MDVYFLCIAKIMGFKMRVHWNVEVYYILYEVGDMCSGYMSIFSILGEFTKTLVKCLHDFCNNIPEPVLTVAAHMGKNVFQCISILALSPVFP